MPPIRRFYARSPKQETRKIDDAAAATLSAFYEFLCAGEYKNDRPRARRRADAAQAMHMLGEPKFDLKSYDLTDSDALQYILDDVKTILAESKDKYDPPRDAPGLPSEVSWVTDAVDMSEALLREAGALLASPSLKGKEPPVQKAAKAAPRIDKVELWEARVAFDEWLQNNIGILQTDIQITAKGGDKPYDNKVNGYLVQLLRHTDAENAAADMEFKEAREKMIALLCARSVDPAVQRENKIQPVDAGKLGEKLIAFDADRFAEKDPVAEKPPSTATAAKGPREAFTRRVAEAQDMAKKRLPGYKRDKEPEGASNAGFEALYRAMKNAGGSNDKGGKKPPSR